MSSKKPGQLGHNDREILKSAMERRLTARIDHLKRSAAYRREADAVIADREISIRRKLSYELSERFGIDVSTDPIPLMMRRVEESQELIHKVSEVIQYAVPGAGNHRAISTKMLDEVIDRGAGKHGKYETQDVPVPVVTDHNGYAVSGTAPIKVTGVVHNKVAHLSKTIDDLPAAMIFATTSADAQRIWNNMMTRAGLDAGEFDDIEAVDKEV